jgi:heme b synthase
VHCRAEAEDSSFAGELKLNEIKTIIDNIASNYSPILVLTGGEPLYRDDIFDIAKYATGKNLRTALATNGTLIDAGIADRIKESQIARVSISIDGIDAKSHDSFRGVDGSYDEALNGARLLREHGVEFQFNTTITKRNVDCIDEILNLAIKEKASALHIFMLVPVGCGIELAESDMISSEKYEEALNWFYERSRQTGIEFRATCAPHYYRIIRQRAKDEGRVLSFETDGMAAMTRGCLAGTGVCFISNTGEVQPCGYLPVSTGNVLKTPFADIWEKSDLFSTLRDFKTLKGKCGICEFKVVCGGCRARAYYATNDFTGEEPYCLYRPGTGIKA